MLNEQGGTIESKTLLPKHNEHNEHKHNEHTNLTLPQRVERVTKWLHETETLLQRPGVQKNAERRAKIEARREALQQRLGKLTEGTEQPPSQKPTWSPRKVLPPGACLPQRVAILKQRIQHHHDLLQRPRVQANPPRRDAIQERAQKMTARLAEWERKLEKQNNEQPGSAQDKKTMTMEERIAMLERKLEHHEQILARKASRGDTKNVDRVEQRRDHIQARLLLIRQRQQIRQQHRRNHVKKQHKQGRGAAPLLRRQAMEQERLINQQRRLELKKEEALFTLALDQVYVAHYPHDMDHLDDAVLEANLSSSSPMNAPASNKKYIPVLGKQTPPIIMALRAMIRNEAIQRARTEKPVAWMTADMYHRLPEMWTLEEELTYFGKRGQHPRQKLHKGFQQGTKSEWGAGLDTKDDDDDDMIVVPVAEKEALVLPEEKVVYSEVKLAATVGTAAARDGGGNDDPMDTEAMMDGWEPVAGKSHKWQAKMQRRAQRQAAQQAGGM